MKLLEFKGSHYEIGVQVGKYFYVKAQKLYSSLIFSEDILQKTEKSLAYFQKMVPDLMEYIKGFCKGSHQPFLQVLAYVTFQNEVTEGSEKCTTILVQTLNGPMLAHSEDDYSINQNKFFLGKFSPHGHLSYISGCYIGLLPGDNVGMNEYGLTVSVNSLTYKKVKIDGTIGLPLSFIGNILLKMKNMKETKIFLSSIIPNHGCHFLIISPDGNALSAELLPNGQRQIKEITQLVHANHPLDHTLARDCGITMSSFKRQKMLSSWLKSHQSVHLKAENLQNLLKSKACNNLGICRNGINIYKDVSTIAAFIVEPKNRTLLMAKGEPCKAKEWHRFQL